MVRVVYADQHHLAFDAKPADPAAVASPDGVRKVLEILGRNGQQFAAEICLELGLIANENNKRKVRAIARAAFPYIISFAGSDGYKLLRQASIEEAYAVLHAIEASERDLICKKRLLLDAIHSGKVGVT
jgi:hypothetical protein